MLVNLSQIDTLLIEGKPFLNRQDVNFLSQFKLSVFECRESGITLEFDLKVMHKSTTFTLFSRC